jgi:hypothetical protein
MLKMAHDVFISHAHKDIEIAKAICRKLELARIRCWIAQRDIVAGDDWTVATRKAIGSSRVLLVLLSDNANAATHIEREIAQAFYSRLPILPVRLSEAPLKRDFLFYLSDVRCFEASKLPEEQYLEPLTASAKVMVQNSALASNVLPSRTPPAHTNLTGFSDSWVGAVQASHYRTLDIVKKLSITVIVFSVGWVFWYFYSAGKSDGPPATDGQHAARHVFVPSPDPAPQATVEASPPKPEYTYSRLGLWIASKNAETPAAQERHPSAPVAESTPLMRSTPAAEITPSPGVTPSADTGPLVQSTPAAQSTPVAEAAPSTDTRPLVQSVPAAQSTPVAEATPSVDTRPLAQSTPAADSTPLPEANPSADSRPIVESTPPTNSAPSAETRPSTGTMPAAESTPGAQSTEAVKPGERAAEAEDGFKPSLKEQSLKELVLDYLRTVASDDDSAQERFFARRVNFYGKGLLPISGVRASMDRYRQEWPVRNWEPEGEPEFPEVLHSTHPELYEVLQPFSWTVANGSRRKTGRETLYVRIRRDEKGLLQIIHLELRHPGENSSR